MKFITEWIFVILLIFLFFICENNVFGVCQLGRNTWFDGSPSLIEGLENENSSCDAQTSVNSTVYANAGFLKNLQDKVEEMDKQLKTTTNLAQQNQDAVKRMVSSIKSQLDDKQKQLRQVGQEQQEGGLTS